MARLKPLFATVVVFATTLSVAAWPATANPQTGHPWPAALASVQSAMTLHHVHGLAFSTDGKTLTIPSHDGLALYRDGRWAKAPGPAHDYMGFTRGREALYSSGHPAPGLNLPNPFGLLRSRDGGKTWERLGLTGEADFHLMAVSYETSAIYVFNAVPNSRMRATGIHWTADQGQSWKPARAQRLEGRLLALAVHPRTPGIVAAGTDRGLFISRDHGDRFQRVGGAVSVTAVAFDSTGERIWLGMFDGKAKLARLRPGNSSFDFLALPPLGPQDAVAYIAWNPADRNQWAIATFGRNVYLTANAGKTWRRIAADGKTL